MHLLLKPAVEAARAALRALDADQVPSDLRRVRDHSGGSLPPPLAKSLLRGLDQYGWLREKSLEHLEAEGSGAGGWQRAAALYLRRDTGWELELAGAAAAEGERRSASKEREAEGRVLAAEKAADAIRARLQAERDRRLKEVAALEARITALNEERRRAPTGGRRVDDEARATAALERAAGLAVERDALAVETAGLRESLREERRRRRRAEEAAAGAEETGVWVGGDPEAIAVRVDMVARMSRPPARDGDSAPAGHDPGTPGLPAGIAPDASAAIDWLLSSGRRATVIVDGYNVGFLLAGARLPATARSRLAPVLDRLATLASAPLRVVVVYDSALEVSEVISAPGPVSVRFTEAGRTADEEIADLSTAAGLVVVISNDRAVRDAADAAGAVPLWARALVEWCSRR